MQVSYVARPRPPRPLSSDTCVVRHCVTPGDRVLWATVVDDDQHGRPDHSNLIGRVCAPHAQAVPRLGIARFGFTIHPGADVGEVVEHH